MQIFQNQKRSKIFITPSQDPAVGEVDPVRPHRKKKAPDPNPSFPFTTHTLLSSFDFLLPYPQIKHYVV